MCIDVCSTFHDVFYFMEAQEMLDLDKDSAVLSFLSSTVTCPISVMLGIHILCTLNTIGHHKKCGLMARSVLTIGNRLQLGM